MSAVCNYQVSYC